MRIIPIIVAYCITIYSSFAIAYRSDATDLFDDWVESQDPCNLCKGFYKGPLSKDGSNSTINIIAKSAILEKNSKKETVIKDANFRLYENNTRGEAKKIKIQDNTITMENSKQTTCSPKNKSPWYLKTRKLVLNRNTGRGEAIDARLMLNGDFPIFYFPYYNFPIDNRRQTGFLDPHIGFRDNYGFELATPYYLNLKPNVDATITPRLLSRRGLALQGTWRYLTHNSNGTIKGAILPHDRLYDNFRTQKLNYHPNIKNDDPRIKALGRKGLRGSFGAKHQTKFNNNIVANIDYSYASDSNYFADLSNNFLFPETTTSLLQQGTLTLQNDYGSMKTILQQHQILNPYKISPTSEPYRFTPKIALKSSDFIVNNNIHYGVNGEYTHFTHKFSNTKVIGSRFHARPYITYKFIKPYLEVTPRIQLDYLGYNLSNRANPRPSSRTIPIFDINSKLILERSLNINNNSIIQTLEPGLYYLYIPYKKDQHLLPNFDTKSSSIGYNQLFRVNRFTGLDRLGDTSQITASLTSRFYEAASGFEIVKLNIGQIFYLKNRKVGLNKEQLQTQKSSNIFATATYNIENHLSVYTNITWDHRRHKIATHTLGAQYLPDELSAYNINYKFTKDLEKNNVTERKIIVNAAIPIYPNRYKWRALGSLRYNLKASNATELLAGLERNDCCTAFRILLGRKRNAASNTTTKKRYNHTLGFEFVFKGLTAVGDHGIEETLNKAIPGYKWNN